MKACGFAFLAVLFLNNGLVLCQDKTKPAKPAPAVLKYPLALSAANVGKLESLEANGTAFLERQETGIPRAAQRNISTISEGYFLGFVAKELGRSLEGAHLVLIQVTEVVEDGWKVQLGAEAAKKLKKGSMVVIFRPPGSTTALMKQAPAIAPIIEGGEAKSGTDPRAAAKLAQSKNNLKQLGLAFHNYHDTHLRFPPAVIFGPDGKPWHSWRVLLLPFLDQAALYNQYKFDEPWDGPNNKKLLEKMPAIFRDPLNGDQKGLFTHYAVAVGKNTAFSKEGGKLDGKRVRLDEGGKRIRDFTDGTTNTMLVRSVSPDKKIPWMKPEDVTFDDKFPGIGKKGGFSAPYKKGKETAGIFLRCDGSVLDISSKIDKKTLTNFITLNDGQILDELPRLDSPRQGPMVMSLHIVKTDKGVVARLVREPAVAN